MKTAEQWINTIKDETVKRYLNEQRIDWPKTEKIETFDTFLGGAFIWSRTPQGKDFWDAICTHFKDGLGLKRYEDFKHLDESI